MATNLELCQKRMQPVLDLLTQAREELESALEELPQWVIDGAESLTPEGDEPDDIVRAMVAWVEATLTLDIATLPAREIVATMSNAISEMTHPALVEADAMVKNTNAGDIGRDVVGEMNDLLAHYDASLDAGTEYSDDVVEIIGRIKLLVERSTGGPRE